MLRRFLPREEDFFSLFERHAALTVDGAKQFVKLVSGGQSIKALAARIKEIEHEADVIALVDGERQPFEERPDAERLGDALAAEEDRCGHGCGPHL